MPPLGFEPTIPVSERPQTHALDRTATAIGVYFTNCHNHLLHLQIYICNVNQKQIDLPHVQSIINSFSLNFAYVFVVWNF
jgi:hypothetical protein